VPFVCVELTKKLFFFWFSKQQYQEKRRVINYKREDGVSCCVKRGGDVCQNQRRLHKFGTLCLIENRADYTVFMTELFYEPEYWINHEQHKQKPVPETAQSQSWVCGRLLAGIAVSNFFLGRGYFSLVSVVCCQAQRGICVGLITRPEESYQVWCVWVWSWSLDNEEVLAHEVLLRHGKKKNMQGEQLICFTYYLIVSCKNFSTEELLRLTMRAEI